MTLLRKLLVNPRLNGMNRVHFYFGLVLIFSAPFLGKIPLIFFGEKLDGRLGLPSDEGVRQRNVNLLRDPLDRLGPSGPQTPQNSATQCKQSQFNVP